MVVTVRGVEYGTLAGACRAYNLNVNTVKHRLYRGWSVDEAFELQERINNCSRFEGNQLVIKGVPYRSVKSYCDRNGLVYMRVMKRLSRGWSLEEALGLTSRRK